ncbi:MAG TPA: DUF5995 family protein [Cytophagales bacterium]|nr:DUF5995 family protein [Cytophagales bacterium]
MLPTTIDEVITEMESIIQECIKTNNRAGYFAALYHAVTCRIKQGIAAGEFEDNIRMEKLDVCFANRYLTAWRTWKTGGQTSEAWRVAFTACKQWNPVVLQHLLLGMNAHINLDLGIATVEVTKGADIETIHRDFNLINTILASMVYKVINQLNQVSPLLSLLGFHATNTNLMLVQFTIEQARDGAWVFASDLSRKSGNIYDSCIKTRDTSIAKLAYNLANPQKLARFTTFVIRVFETQKTKKVIQVLLK